MSKTAVFLAVAALIARPSSGARAEELLARGEVEKGEYRLDATAAKSLSFCISNHDQSPSHPVLFPIIGRTNVVFRANGSRLVVNGQAVVFYIAESRNVRLEGFEVEPVRPVMTEMTIVGFRDGGTLVRVDRDRYPFVLRDGRIVMTGPGWESGVGGAKTFDGRTREMIALSGDTMYDGAAEEAEDGLLLLKCDFKGVGTGMKAGDIVVLRPRKRPMPCIVVANSSGVELVDVIVHDAQGMALVAQHAENVSWRGTAPASSRKCGVFPSAGRYSSMHADATHFSNVKGEVVVENCLFEGMMDDAINVHSTCLKIVGTGGGNVLRCRHMHEQAVGFDVFRPGERLRFIRGRTLENGPEAVVVSLRRLDEREVELALDRPMPPPFGTGDAVENADYQPSAVFRGNIVRNNRARAALFTTLRPVLCEDNLFERVTGSAVLLAGDSSIWYESGACRDVTIRGNVFSNCCTSARSHGFCKGVISICPTVKDLGGQREPYHRNVRITGNDFFTFDVPLLYARSATNVVFDANRVVRNSDYPGWGEPEIVSSVPVLKADGQRR